jgi:hypothetical protein
VCADDLRVSDAAGAAAVQPLTPRTAPASGGTNRRRAGEQGCRRGHGRGEPRLPS